MKNQCLVLIFFICTLALACKNNSAQIEHQNQVEELKQYEEEIDLTLDSIELETSKAEKEIEELLMDI